MDSELLAPPVDSEKVNVNCVGGAWKSSTKQVPKVTCGFVRVPNPVDLETVNEN